MSYFLEISLTTVLKVGAVFAILLILVLFFGYLAFFKPPKEDIRSGAITQTNILIREKLVYLSNERKSLDKKDRRSHEIIQKAGAITNAHDLGRAIQRFYTLGSNP